MVLSRPNASCHSSAFRTTRFSLQLEILFHCGACVGTEQRRRYWRGRAATPFYAHCGRSAAGTEKRDPLAPKATSTLASLGAGVDGAILVSCYEDDRRTDPLASKASSTLASLGSGVDGAALPSFIVVGRPMRVATLVPCSARGNHRTNTIRTNTIAGTIKDNQASSQRQYNQSKRPNNVSIGVEFGLVAVV